MNSLLFKQKGFTLIELVTVIVILGVLAVGISSFLQFGTRIFSETSARDELISSARFSVERINREVRHALPNSVEAYDNGNSLNCISFTPIVLSTIYTDIPVEPEPASKDIFVIPFEEADGRYSNDLSVIVYPLSVDDLDTSSGKIYSINALDTSVTPWLTSLDTIGNIHFAADSPTNRLFFIDGTTKYCVIGSNLYRYENNLDGVLMAENIINYIDGNNIPVFSVANATQRRNATIQTRLMFSLNDELITFNNEVQIPNVP